ncbi:hypothetical protein J3R83DRAFT_7185 [Lanmaoa asiatica]|nr:hypothetical protein J3R83DRAFT_7185 [Lanmaoa asiatica]
MKGGIIGWLAREALGDDVDLAVQCGPSDNILQYGTTIQIGQSYYWDDNLTEDDKLIICVVYKFLTGQCHTGGQQIANVLWWPKQSTGKGLVWMLDIGRWTMRHGIRNALKPFGAVRHMGGISV